MNNIDPIVKVCHCCEQCLPINCFILLPHRKGYFNICKQCASRNILKRLELFRNSVV